MEREPEEIGLPENEINDISEFELKRPELYKDERDLSSPVSSLSTSQSDFVEKTDENILPVSSVQQDNSNVQDIREENGKMVKLELNEYESGLKSYLVKVNPQFIQECYTHDIKWEEDFRKNIGPKYPYTMSPKTTQLIANASTEFKKEMSKSGFEINPWKISSDEEPYVMGVLRKIMIPDTVESIIDYTDHMSNHLKELKEKDPSFIPSIRSYFCGAGVADKCLMTRLYELGITGNLIATDIAADSIAVAALNFSVWNELLPENDRYEIHIVKGSVPTELYTRDRTVIFQVEDALLASEEDSKLPIKYDALVLDNGLQYVSKEFTRELTSNFVNNIGKDGLYIGTQGLDSDIKVEISKLHHFSQILKSKIVDLRKDYAKKGTFKAPYGYPHKYSFSVNKDSGLILIDKVVSDCAARTYTWSGKLLSSDIKRFREIIDAMGSATELSRANKVVETTPFDYHNEMIATITSKNLTVEEKERPLNYEDFGWQKINGDLYSNGKETVDGGTMMRLCKEQDPLVLRISRILIKNSN